MFSSSKRLKKFTVIVSSVFWGLATPPTFAQQYQGAELCDEPIIFGCGKAQAMATAQAHQDASEPIPGLREALSDTNVLHHTLDIEISNLDTVANTCTIAGTNATLIESASPSLTQYTFRLRNQYVITSVIITDEFGNNPVDVTAGLTTPKCRYGASLL